jgi:mannitol-1-phosphate/altronate dehydrogenase
MKQFKTKTKVEIEYDHWANGYIDTFYHYPSFQEIVDRIVSNASKDQREEIKEKITNKLFQ